MAYQYIKKDKLSQEDYKTAFLLSDGKRWHNVSAGIVNSTHEFIKHELDKMSITSDKTLLILNPIFFQEEVFSNIYLECQVSLRIKDDKDEQRSIRLEKTKIRNPYPNKKYAQCSMKSGNKVCRMGQVFVFDSFTELRKNCHEIEFSWTVRLKEDESFVYGAKTVIKPDFTSNNGTEPNWFYLKNIDVWFSKKKDLYNQSWDFPNYQRKEICLPHYDSKKTSQEENWMEDIEEIQTQKLSVSLFSDDSFWDTHFFL
ncbi:hypothetical protein EFE32_00635 [Lactococcus lactis subsp. lactis]|uniref:hypothetical protein n=1 Tax=Lactococcus lactis TaxID=1358 RepID=UPI00223C48AA|nr:hypothetical protein [Lactococcus lactis]MCT0015386.1 hypothetical protein [Lactococcus lactis subsp. lactis]